MAHYWTANDDRATRKAQIIDWVTDLQEFPIGAIDGAIITWRQTQNRRPTPADIRALILPERRQPEVAIPAAAYEKFPKSKLTLRQLQKHRQNWAKYWDLVQRARAGEDVEMLIAEHKRMIAEDFERDPELRVINEIIEQEEREERRGRRHA